jgi:hypothetical protein
MEENTKIKTRKEKEKILQEIISKLSISSIEQDIYILSLEVLEDDGFDDFYQKITQQIEFRDLNSIAPLSSTLM